MLILAKEVLTGFHGIGHKLCTVAHDPSGMQSNAIETFLLVRLPDMLRQPVQRVLAGRICNRHSVGHVCCHRRDVDDQSTLALGLGHHWNELLHGVHGTEIIELKQLGVLQRIGLIESVETAI